MKLRISFFDSTVLKKDIFRFAPIWAVYTIFGVLFQSVMLGNPYYRISANLAIITGSVMGLVNAGYGIVVALYLFGDLSNSRLCNAFHAMPLRRETWFCTHFVAGLLFSLVPNTLIALIFLPMMGSLWFTALIWLGGATLSYLFFFGAAVLSIMCTGTKFGAITVYGLINFVAIEIYWMVLSLIIPMYRGVHLTLAPFSKFSPLVALASNIKPYYVIKHACPAEAHSEWYTNVNCVYKFDGYGDNWGYLFAIAAVGVAFAVLALVLYRHRQLETAGDFAAVKPVKWAVSIFGSIGFGMVFRVFGYGSEGAQMLLLFLGLSVGFILLQMILQHRIKVFERKTFIKLGALILAMILFLVLGASDVLGVESRIPKAEDVEKVYLANANLSPEDIQNGYNSHYVILTDAKDVEKVRQFHQQMVDMGGSVGSYSWVTIYYELKNGSTLCRTYTVSIESNFFEKITENFKAQLVFGVSSLNEILSQPYKVNWDGVELTKDQAKTLLQKLWTDAENGRLGEKDSNYDWNTPFANLMISWGSEDESNMSKEEYRWLDVRPDATESWAYLKLLQDFYDVQFSGGYVDY